MKSKFFCFVTVLSLISIVATPGLALAATGKIKSLYPPGNNGSRPGSGVIVPRNSSGTLEGPPYLIFQTPKDVVARAILSEGLNVTYTLGKNNQATDVQPDRSGTIDIISLDQGTYLYSVYARKIIHGGSTGGDTDRRTDVQQEASSSITTYIEIVESPMGTDKSPAVSAIGSIPFVGGVLSDLILEVDNTDVWNQLGLIQVNPTSMIEVLAAEGAGNHSGLQLMTKGKVKFFNDEKRRKVIGSNQREGVYLVLPEEVKEVVDEILVNGNRVFIIIRTQEGKKGPNAVNVKLA